MAPPLKPATLPPAFSQHLDNGMEVVVVSNDEIPWVSATWYLLAGAKFDQPGKGGTASVTASLLRQGTTEHDADALAELLDYHAIDLGGTAGNETTVVYCGSLDRHIDRAVKTLAEVVRKPVFAEREVRRHVAQEVNGLQVAEADGKYWAGRELQRRIYGRHYLSRPAEGTSRSLVNVTRDDLVAFHREHYMPDNSLLVFSGAIMPAQAVELAKRYFADWAPGTEAACQTEPIPEPGETRIYLVDRPWSTQSQIRVGQLGFRRTDPQYVPAQVFNQVFGGSFSSRLNSKVRVEEGLTYGAGGGYRAGKERGYLAAYTFTKNETTAEAVKAVLEVIESMQTEPPTGEELSDAQSYLTGRFGLSLETPKQVAGKVFELKFYGLPDDYYETYLQRVNSLTASDIISFARQTIDSGRLSIIVVGDAARIKDSLAEIAPVTVVKPETAGSVD